MGYEKRKKVKKYSLDRKINSFFSLCKRKFVKGGSECVSNSLYLSDIKNLMEKMAVWYEMRYNDVYVNKCYPGSSIDGKFNKKIIIESENVKDVLTVLNEDEKTVFLAAIDLIKWEEVFSYEAFLDSLMWSDKWFLEISEGDRVFNNNIKLLRENFLDCVMYRLIERGGNRIGPRRAFMFAMEFKRNIDIPLIYGIDSSDPGLRRFVLEYIKAGGNYDLECLAGYGSRYSNHEPLCTITIGKILKTHNHNCAERFTEEERELYKRLVNILSFKNSNN